MNLRKPKSNSFRATSRRLFNIFREIGDLAVVALYFALFLLAIYAAANMFFGKYLHPEKYWQTQVEEHESNLKMLRAELAVALTELKDVDERTSRAARKMLIRGNAAGVDPEVLSTEIHDYIQHEHESSVLGVEYWRKMIAEEEEKLSHARDEYSKHTSITKPE